MDKTSNRTKMERFSYTNIKYYLPLLICSFMMAGCSDSADDDDDKIGGGNGATTTTNGGGGPNTTLDPRSSGTCQDVAEREIAGQSGLSAHQGNACTDDSDSYIIQIIEASRISDSENGVCCNKTLY